MSGMMSGGGMGAGGGGWQGSPQTGNDLLAAVQRSLESQGLSSYGTAAMNPTASSPTALPPNEPFNPPPVQLDQSPAPQFATDDQRAKDPFATNMNLSPYANQDALIRQHLGDFYLGG